jgi:hypothetical protein
MITPAFHLKSHRIARDPTSWGSAGGPRGAGARCWVGRLLSSDRSGSPTAGARSAYPMLERWRSASTSRVERLEAEAQARAMARVVLPRPR